jgi:hypothetical protein
MNSSNGNVLKRIVREEPEDPSRLEETRARVAEHFENRRKKLLIWATVWILIGVFIAFWGCKQLALSDNLGMMLFATAVILIGYETTVLIKLWYWTVDSKLDVQRELKRLQLLVSRASAVNGDPNLAKGIKKGASLWSRMSRKTVGWLSTVLLIAGGLVGGAVFLQPAAEKVGSGDPVYRMEFHAEVATDSSVDYVGRLRQAYPGVEPIDAIDIRCPERLDDVIWTTRDGTVLEHEESQADDMFIYTVALPRTVYRHDEFELRLRWQEAARETPDGGERSFVPHPAWRGGLSPRYALWIGEYPSSEATCRSSVALPSGASVVSEDISPAARRRPQGEMQYAWTSWVNYDGRILYSFANLSYEDGEPLRRIVYRIAED